MSSFKEWMPELDRPDTQERDAVKFAKEVPPGHVMARLAMLWPTYISGVTLNRIRALILAGPHEVPPEPHHE